MSGKPKKTKQSTLDNDDEDILGDSLTADGNKKVAIDPTKLLPNKQPKKPKKEKNDPFASSSEEDDNAPDQVEERDLFSATGKKDKNDPFADSDDSDFGSFKPTPHKKSVAKASKSNMFGDDDGKIRHYIYFNVEKINSNYTHYR